MMAFGVTPKVASCTGMYLVFWSSLLSTIINQMEGFLDIRYGLSIGVFVVVGTILGNRAADWYVKKKGGS
jgi:uncharacterized membrane protein YfcA